MGSRKGSRTVEDGSLPISVVCSWVGVGPRVAAGRYEVLWVIWVSRRPLLVGTRLRAGEASE